MILPIGHEEGAVRRWPVVTLAVIALCLFVHLRIGEPDPDVSRRVDELGAQILQYWVEHPWLDLAPEVAGQYAHVVDLVRRTEEAEPSQRPPARMRSRQQAELDELVAAWRAERSDSPFLRYGLVPSRFEVPDLVTSMFLHADWLHLVGNMFFLWLAGPALEDIWGRGAFAAFYLVVGVAGGLAWVLIHPASTVPCVGASGAIAGLMGAFAVRFRFSKIHFVYFFFMVPLGLRTGTFSAPAWLMLGLWAARETLFGTASGGGSGIAHWVHVAGFGSGVAGALLLGRLDLEGRFERANADPAKEIRNEALEEAYRLRGEGRAEEAWSLLRGELAARPGNQDVALASWDLAIDLGRTVEAAPAMVGLVRRELRQREIDLALQHWFELREHVPEVRAPVDLRVPLADAMVDRQLDAEAAALLAGLDRDLPEGTPSGLLSKAAKAACRACSTAAPVLTERALADPHLPEELKGELRSDLARARSRGLTDGPKPFGVEPSEEAEPFGFGDPDLPDELPEIG